MDIQELLSLKIDSTQIDLLYFDWSYYDSEGNEEIPVLDTNEKYQKSSVTEFIGPKSYAKSVQLTQRTKDLDVKKLVADFLKDNIKEIESLPKFSISEFKEKHYIPEVTKFENFEDQLLLNQEIGTFEKQIKEKIKSKLTYYSYYIANDGCIGGVNTYILNSKTNDKYLSPYLDNITIVINDNIDDNVIYLLRNNKMEEPGYKYVYHTDIDGNFYSEIISCGLFPQKQTSKFVIYE